MPLRLGQFDNVHDGGCMIPAHRAFGRKKSLTQLRIIPSSRPVNIDSRFSLFARTESVEYDGNIRFGDLQFIWNGDSVPVVPDGKKHGNLKPLQKRAIFSRKIGLQEVVILTRSLIQQSLRPYGFRYIRFVFRNLLKNRRLFPEAVRLALQGHHFYMITRQAMK